MQQDKMISGLLSCGLSEKEVHLFCTLSRLGTCNASTLVRESRILRVDAYRILKKLQEKKLVKLSKDRPVKFSAVSFEKAISDIIDARKERIRRLMEIRDELKDLLVAEGSASTIAPRFNIVQGRHQILLTIAKIHSRSKVEICIIEPKKLIVRDVTRGIDDILKQCSECGVKIRVLTNIDSENLESVKRFLQFSEVRHFPLNQMGQIIISDNKETLTVVQANPSLSSNVKDETAIWTDAESYASFQKTIFDELWRDAVEGIKRVTQIESIIQFDRSCSASQH